jgi:hypothetical protein
MEVVFGRLDSRKIDFNIDNMGVDAIHCATKGLKEHNLLTGGWRVSQPRRAKEASLLPIVAKL